jgi:hypothetical protein
VNGNNASGITGGTAPTNGYKGGDGRNSDNAGVNGGVGAGGSGAFRNTTTTLISGGNGEMGKLRLPILLIVRNILILKLLQLQELFLQELIIHLLLQ